MGQRIRQARLAKGLNISQLAAALEISPAAVQNWDSGSTKPSGSNLPRVAGALGVTPEWLRSGDHPGSDAHPWASPGDSIEAVLTEAKGRLAEALGVKPHRISLTFSIGV